MAGRSRDRAARTVLWTIADGSRGRRWREATFAPDGSILRAVTLETGDDGALQRLEVAAGASLVTLHPEPDGSIHGNALSPAGVEHLAFMGGGLAIDIPDSVVGEAALCLRLGHRVGIGSSERIAVIRVALVAGRNDVRPECGGEVRIEAGELQLVRESASRWRLGGPTGTARTVELDGDGLPRRRDEVWPLEIDGSSPA